MARREPLYSAAAATLGLYVRATVRLRVQGAENVPRHGPAVLVANHVSYLDPIVLGVIINRLGRKVRFIAVEELFQKPIIGTILRVLNQIPNNGQPRGVLREAEKALARGDLILIYPEGTIPTAMPVRPRRGAAVLAISQAVDIIPMASRGLERRAFSLRRRVATVRIGTPMDLTEFVHGTERVPYKAITESLIESIRKLADVNGNA
jgi:1-acyl-sn-glycerol-3-phosphate acyltransferase